MYAGVLVFTSFIVSVLGCDENQAKLRYYYKSIDNYTEICIDEAEKIFSTPWYDPNRKTVIFCHGFIGHPKGPAVTAVVTAYLSSGQYNVALLNWDKLASVALPTIVSSFTKWAVPNAIKLGEDFSVSLLRLSAAGLDLNNTHFVGHSLGAHVLGMAGNKVSLKGVQLACIMALDPSIGFDGKPLILKINPSSARFVSVTHSDPSKFGSRQTLGVVDIWPNFSSGPVLQPGCPRKPARFSEDEFCSHNRVWELHVEAITTRRSVLASHAKNVRVWNKYSDAEKRKNVLDIGVCDFNTIPGNYYMRTAPAAPYGLGEKGL